MERKKRITALIFGFLMSMCFGAGYAWSVFAQELFKNYSFTMAAAQFPFAIFQVAFAAGFLLGGRVIKRTGPRTLALAGGVVMGAGFFVAGSLPPDPLLLVLLVGVLGGGGAGLAYICPLETVQKCFPEKKAVVTGISVGGLGAGTFCMALGADHLLRIGMPVTDIWKLLGIVFFVLICISAIFLKFPGQACEEEQKPLPYREIFRSRNFWALFAAIATSIFAGLMVIGNMKKMGMKWGMAEVIATLGVSILAIFNAFGRITWGFIIHKIGEIRSIYISMVLQTVVMIFAIFLIKNEAAFFLFAILVGLNYGCALVVYASSVSRFFGIERLGQIYPMLFASNFISGLTAPPFAGFIFDRTGSYNIAFFSACGILILGIILFWLLFKNPEKTR